jgi:hypothetical protein
MKTTIKRPVEIEISHVLIKAPVRYEEEDIPNDFPLRKGDMWTAKVNIDTGQIEGWPKGKDGYLHMKVTDSGSYSLLRPDGTEAALLEDYVPGVVPGESGDYIILEINTDGVITNWPKKPDVSRFFQEEE